MNICQLFRHTVVLPAAAIVMVQSCAHKTQEPTSDLPTAYPSYTGEYEGYTLKLDERFDRFDDAMWEKGDGAVGGEAACRFQDQGVEVADGKLAIIVRREPIEPGWSDDHVQQKNAYEFSCGEMRTLPTKRIKFGRIETRVKAPDRASASGYISSLFTYTNEGTPREWEEIDIELEGGRPDKFQANVIYGFDTWEWWRTREWGAWEDKIVTGPVDEWRVFAIEWTPTALRWYVDGKLVKTLTQEDFDCKPECVAPQIHATPIPDNLTDIMMNFWIPKDNIQDHFGGNKRDNKYPMKTEYDWIRIYELNSHPFDLW